MTEEMKICGMKMKICSNLFKYNTVVADELVGFLSALHGQRTSVSRISECHPSLWHSSHLTAKFSGPRSLWADVCGSQIFTSPGIRDIAKASPWHQTHLIMQCLSTYWSSFSRGFNLFIFLSLQCVFVWKTTILTLVFVSNEPQPPQRDLSRSYSECDLPQWNVVAVCKMTVKVVLVFCSSSSIASAYEGKQGLSGCQDCKLRLISEKWAVLSWHHHPPPALEFVLHS